MTRSTHVGGPLNPLRPATTSTGDSKGWGMCLRTRDLGFCPSESVAETVSMLNSALKASLKVPLNPSISAETATPAVPAHGGRVETATVAVRDVFPGQWRVAAIGDGYE